MPIQAPSRRQSEIMRLVCAGWIMKEIAGEKGISVRTVETHLKRLKARLRARNLTHAAVIFATQLKLSVKVRT